MTVIKKIMIATILAATVASYAFAKPKPELSDRFIQTNFTANKASYNAKWTEPTLVNGWGIAIRPAGAGGHFWIVGDKTSFEYVGDVSQSPDEKLREMHTDKLKYVAIPTGGENNVGTGVVFSDSKKHFVITQKIEGADPITAPSKFIFASDGGIISAWTERKKEDGSFDRSPDAQTVFDGSSKGMQFFGLAISKDYNTLYAADFGKEPAIRAFDGKFQPTTLKFDLPFDTNKNGKVDAGEYAPFNIQQFTVASDESRLFVAYAKTQACPEEEMTKGACKKGEILAGEEDTSKAGAGRIAEFTEEGKLVAVWEDGGKLSAPWGFAFAPQNWGKFPASLLVANFGSGDIAAFDSKTHKFQGYLKDKDGKTLVIDKIWGLIFGNGESLGDKDALYFTAGPNDEKDGLFGSLRLAK